MNVRAADDEDRQRAILALTNHRYALRERPHKDFARYFGQHSSPEAVVDALRRHLTSGGELEVESREPTAAAQTNMVFRVVFEYRGRAVFSHFYLLPHASITNCSVVFASLHPSGR